MSAAAPVFASYAEWLKLLLSIGPKLPAAYAIILAIVEKVQELIALLKPAGTEPGTLELFSVTAEEAELESQVAAAMVPDGSLAAFDGTLLRKLFAFARDNPELFAALMSLLKGLR